MRITVIATGGTIASTDGANDGLSPSALAPSVDAETLLGGSLPDGVQITTRQVLAIDSAAMGPTEMDVVSDAVRDALAEGAGAVVVLHGTDTMEETALLVDLRLGDRCLAAGVAVVFTGAMRGADDPEPDGPSNIRGAVKTAEATSGVSLWFGGRQLPVWGTSKAHTTAPQPFENNPAEASREAASLVLGSLRRGERVRVDVVALYPGADRVGVDALVAAGAQGLVLAAMGAGNANPTVVAAVRDATGLGVAVALSTRVAHGPVYPGYGGGGGGADLVGAGAIVSATMRPGQTRIVLAELLAAGASRAQIRDVLDPGSSR